MVGELGRLYDETSFLAVDAGVEYGPRPDTEKKQRTSKAVKTANEAGLGEAHQSRRISRSCRLDGRRRPRIMNPFSGRGLCDGNELARQEAARLPTSNLSIKQPRRSAFSPLLQAEGSTIVSLLRAVRTRVFSYPGSGVLA